MSSSYNTNSDHDFVSPVSARTHRPHDGFEAGANAPEVVEVHQPHSPSTVVASPQTSYSTTDSGADSPEVTKQYVYGDDTAKEVTHFDASYKMPVPAEHQYTQYPQTTADLRAMNGDAEKAKENGTDPETPAKKQPKILGMSRKLFFIVLVIACIVIAAAVGGGVGASVSKKSKSSDSGSGADQGSATTGSSSSAPTSTGSPTSSASTSATPSPLPKFLNETKFEKGVGFQGFSKDDFQGLYSDVFFTDMGEESVREYDFDIHSYLWIAKITSCCISFCKNGTEEGSIGWACNNKNQTSASEAFSRISVWCAGTEYRNDTYAAKQCANKMK